MFYEKFCYFDDARSYIEYFTIRKDWILMNSCKNFLAVFDKFSYWYKFIATLFNPHTIFLGFLWSYTNFQINSIFHSLIFWTCWNHKLNKELLYRVKQVKIWKWQSWRIHCTSKKLSSKLYVHLLQHICNMRTAFNQTSCSF